MERCTSEKESHVRMLCVTFKLTAESGFLGNALFMKYLVYIKFRFTTKRIIIFLHLNRFTTFYCVFPNDLKKM